MHGGFEKTYDLSAARINYQFGVLYRLTPKVNIALSSPISSGISLESSGGSNWDRLALSLSLLLEG